MPLHPLIKNFLTYRLKSWLLIALLVAIGYWGFARQVDWWLYQLHSTRIARDALRIDSRLRATGLPIQTLGQVGYQGMQWPIEAALHTVPTASKTLCVFSGVHGNEPAGVEATLALAGALGRQPNLYAGLNVVIVPLVNPAGWTHDLRRNGENKDIARNFVNGSTQESELVKKFLAAQHCDTLVDLHEDRLGRGVYLLAYGDHYARSSAQALSKAIAASGAPIYSSVADGVYYLSPQDYASIQATTLSLYAQQHGVAHTYIAETPMRLPLQSRVTIHSLVIDTLAWQLMERTLTH